MEIYTRKNPKDIGNPDFVSKIENGQVEVTSIHTDNLPYFLRVASVTGFKVEEIAKEGDPFPLPASAQIGNVPIFRVIEENHIAVSIERPEGIIDHKPFWENLISLRPK